MSITAITTMAINGGGAQQMPSSNYWCGAPHMQWSHLQLSKPCHICGWQVPTHNHMTTTMGNKCPSAQCHPPCNVMWTTYPYNMHHSDKSLLFLPPFKIISVDYSCRLGCQQTWIFCIESWGIPCIESFLQVQISCHKSMDSISQIHGFHPPLHGFHLQFL